MHKLITMGNQVELRHLRYFLAVAETLNFRKAANKLYITQPGLSRQIAQLEEEVGAQLFDRSNKKVTLTVCGQYLKEEATSLLQQVEAMMKQVSRMQTGEVGELRIGFVGSAMQQVVPGLLKKLNSQWPGVHTVLTELANQAQIDAILNKSLDLGFIRSVHLPVGLNRMKVHEDSFSLVLPQGHALSTSNFQSLGQLKHENFILFHSDYSHGYYEKIMSIFEHAGFYPSIAHRSVHATTIFRLVENGLGIGIVPTSLQHGFAMNIHFIELTKIPQRTILWAVWLKGHDNPILERAINML